MVQRILDQRYELEELIGGGGMADVYRAKDRLLNRPVAVKILHEAFKQDKEFIDKFQREAQAAARLSHPNIVNIYDVGVADGDHYIVMEYVPGRTLKDRIRQEGHLSVSESLRVAREIAEALAHAHANNLVHCDIKPHNILMMADGHAKVADFGIARAVTESTMTYSGNVIGSVHYFSPEQAKGTMITPKSDVYSLGVVLYEMLTGKLPFTGENPVSIAVKHLQEEPVPVRQIDPAIPPVVEAIVSKAMSKDPAMRPTSAELVQDISQAERMLMAGTPQTPAMMAQDPDATQVLPRVQPVQQSIPPRRAPQNEVYEQDEPEQEKSIFKSKKFIAGLLVVLLAGFFIGAFMSYGKFWSTAEVTVPDVTGKQMLAHAATAMGFRAVNAILGKSDKIRLDIMPSAVFTYPEAATVGLSEDACKQLGKPCKCLKGYYRANGKALAIAEPEGMVKITADTDGTILGCTAYGAHSADMVQEIAALMNCNATTDDLASIIHIHPTLSEILQDMCLG